MGVHTGENAMKKSSLAALALLAGCAGQQVELTEDSRRTLTTQPVHATHVLAQGGFLVESSGYTAAGVLFSPLVVLAQAAEGSTLRSELGLEDPVVRVKERVLGALEAQYKLPNVTRMTEPMTSAQYKSLTGIVLEARTTRWGIDNNRVKYAAGVRVTRLADGVVLWDAICAQTIADIDKPSPTSEMLRADNGALLKAQLNRAADTCGDQLAAWAVQRAERR
jgi:hypothetical protein